MGLKPFIRLVIICLISNFQPPQFQNDITLNSINGTCNNETWTMSYDYNLWPTCVSYLECPVPSLESEVMIYDWTNATGLAPDTKIT